MFPVIQLLFLFEFVVVVVQYHSHMRMFLAVGHSRVNQHSQGMNCLVQSTERDIFGLLEHFHGKVIAG